MSIAQAKRRKIDMALGFDDGQRESTVIVTKQMEDTDMHVIYKGKQHEVLYTRYCGDYELYALKSRFPDGSMFPAKKTDCRPLTDAPKLRRQAATSAPSADA